MKTVLVTGGNRGIGFETAKQLAAKGYKIYLAARDESKGEQAAQSLRDKGHDIIFVKLDVTKTADIRSLHDILKSNGDSIDILVNNAGVFLESDGPTDSSSASIFKVDPVIILKTIETNTIGPLKLIQSLVPAMMEKGEGRVINISSGMGALGEMAGFWPGYRMSKTALNALTRIVSAEVEGYNIYVNSICPGWVRTDMGGENANRSVEEGVETILWLATCEKPPKGKFLRDCEVIDW